MYRDGRRARPRGTGSLLRHRHRSGAETWYGKWLSDGRQVMRALGPVRQKGSAQGLTPAQAEATLRDAITTTQETRPQPVPISVAEAGQRYLANRESLGLKQGTLADYESYLRVHLSSFFGDRHLDDITLELIEDFIATKRAEGKALKSIRNYLGLLHAIFAHASKRGWCTTNVVAAVDKPRTPREPDIRYLNAAELDALLEATPDDQLGGSSGSSIWPRR